MSAVELLRELVNTFSKCDKFTFSIMNTGDEDASEETIREVCRSLPCRGIELYVAIGDSCHGQACRPGDSLWIRV